MKGADKYGDVFLPKSAGLWTAMWKAGSRRMVTVGKKYYKRGRWRLLICSLAVLVFLLTLGFNQSRVYAAGTRNMSSNASIEFTGGGLKLISIPTFDFGRHPKPEVHTYYAAKRIGPNPVTVEDLNGRGWKLMAKLSTFSNSGNTLSGATLIFNTTAGNIKPSAGTSPGVLPPTAATAEITAGGAAVEVVHAVSGTGSGTWIIDWKEDSTSSANALASTGKDVEIKILASSAKAGKAQAVLDWNLIVAP